MEKTGKGVKFLRSKTFTLVVILVLIILFFYLFSPNNSYLGIRNITSILNSTVIYILFTIAVSFPILSGEFDLSPGYVGTCAGATMATLITKVGVPWPITMIICLAMGIAFGLLNAVLINEFKIQSFIATLTVGSFVARGFSYIIPGGKPIRVEQRAIVWLGDFRIGGVVPIAIIISLVILVIYGIILAKTKFGRSVYLCGGSKKAAQLAGLNPKKISYIIFANSGMLGAFAGMLYAARTQIGDLVVATNTYAFPAVTAAIFGGITFGGGSGNMLGCFLGLLIINGFNNGLTIMGVTSYWQDVASGILLLIALTLDYLSKQRSLRLVTLEMAKRNEG